MCLTNAVHSLLNARACGLENVMGVVEKVLRITMYKGYEKLVVNLRFNLKNLRFNLKN